MEKKNKKKKVVNPAIRITSAVQAQKLSEKLDGIWSKESQLSQRILIYIAQLLEEQNRLLGSRKRYVPKPMGFIARVIYYIKHGGK